MQIGVTERGDAALDLSWKPWVKKGNPAILITKDPMKLADHIDNTMNIIVHCTITGWGGSIIEPNVPEPMNAILGFRKIKTIIGDNRVVLRVDPIITEKYHQSLAVINEVSPICIPRLRISFFDLYDHVKVRFNSIGYILKQNTFHAPLADRLFIYNKIKEMYPGVEVCAEPGLPCSGCISQRDAEVFGIYVGNKLGGQRSTCLCIAEKKELLTVRHPCFHKCSYCYYKD